MKQIIKKLTSCIITAVMALMMLGGVVSASELLKDGQYTINIQALIANTGKVSRADNAITKPVKLEATGGKIYVILEMKDTMTELCLQNSAGGFDKAVKVSQNTEAKTITYKFAVSSIEAPVQMEAYVPAMGSKSNFKLSFDKSSLIDVTPQTTTPVSNTSNTQTTTPVSNASNTQTTTTVKNVSNPKTGDNSFGGLAAVILAASVLSIAIIAIHKIKTKEVSTN